MKISTSEVKRLHDCGHGTADIARILGVTKPTVSYHKRKLGILSDGCGPAVDWAAIRADVEAGVTRSQILKKYGVGSSRYTHALQEGLLPSRAPGTRVDTRWLIANSPISRRSVKRFIIQNALLPYTCALCPQGPTWQGKPLVLVLDHINGVNNDHRLENLRFLCPNCNSQTETFAGRNCRK